MKELSPPRYQLALRTMYYMAKSKVLLTPEELQDALSVERSHVGPSEERRPPIAIVIGVCLGFVFENPISCKMEFFHSTLAEYLSTSSFRNDLELDLGGCCVLYLMSKDLASRCATDKQADERRNLYPFGSYASRFWGDMIRGQSELKYKETLLQFLTSENRISCYQLLPPDMPYDEKLIGGPTDWFDMVNDSYSFDIYTCAYLRLQQTMLSLLEKGIDPDYTAPLGLQYSPLHLGVKALDLKMCRLLVKAGVDANVQNKTGKTPLHLAWELSGDNTSQIRVLLEEAGGRFDIMDSQGRNVLQNALQFGNTSDVYHVINGLGDSGLQNQDLNGDTALHWAVVRRYFQVVQHLLAKNANPLIRNCKGERPLDLAIEDYDRHSKSIATLIVSHINDSSSKYSLESSDQIAITEYLKECLRKEIEAQSTRSLRYERALKTRQNVISAAEQEDPYTLSGYILDGVDVNFVDEDSGMTPLHHAILSNRELPVWHLLAAGTDIELKDKRHGMTAYELAQKCKQPNIVALFQPGSNQPLHAEMRSASLADGVPHDAYSSAPLPLIKSLHQIDRSSMWQQKYCQVGRGVFSKRISGNELRTAYRNARELRYQMDASSTWSGPGIEIWYDYLGYKEPEDGRDPFVRR